MKRTIVQQANQAHTITLPIQWVREHSLGKGSEIDLELFERTIILRTQNFVVDKSLSINASKLSGKKLSNMIAAAYASGVDILKIENEKDITLELHTIFHTLIGYALVEHTKNIYTVKDISGQNQVHIDQIMNQLFQMIIAYYEDAIKDIFNKPTVAESTLTARDAETNKFCLFVQRAINKQAYPDPLLGRIIFTYSYVLEIMSDEITRLWRRAKSPSFKSSKELKDLTLLSKQCLERAFEIYIHYTQEKVDELQSLRDKIRKLSATSEKNQPYVYHVVRISEEATDLNHIALMKNCIQRIGQSSS